MTRYPPPLRKGDLIALIAPSSPLGPDRPVEEIARRVEALGFRARIGDSCRRETACGYAAAPAEVRAARILGGDAVGMWSGPETSTPPSRTPRSGPSGASGAAAPPGSSRLC